MENYKCPQCGETIELGQRFCSNCGCDLGKHFITDPVCPVCHKHYPTGTIYCSEDGARLVKQSDLIYVCQKCLTEYSEEVKYCPKDGGLVVPKYTISNGSNSSNFSKGNLWNRFIAAVIDGFIGGLLAVPSIICYVIGLSTVHSDYYDTNPSDESVLMFVMAFIFYAFPLVYALIKDGLKNGQSIGKKCMNLKVVSFSSRQNCTKSISALRNLVSTLLCFIPLGCFIEPIMVLATSDGRKVGDRAADTMVVNV